MTESFKNPDEKSRKEDLDFLVNQVEQIHPDPYRNINQKKEIFIDSLQKSLEVEKEYFPLAIQESLSLLKDAHTSVERFRKEYLPFVFRTIQGKTYIIGSTSETKEHLYKQVHKINNYPIGKIFEKISALSSQENPEVLLKNLDSLLDSNKILRYYEFSNSKKIDFTTTESFNLEFKGDEDIQMNNPLDWANMDFQFEGNEIYRFRIINNTLLFQYNTCNNRGYTSEELKNFKQKLFNKSHDVKHIVVDLRENAGGLGIHLMEDLFEKLPKNKKNYVASSRKTFSSGIQHLMYLKNTKNATIIGENAGQRANRFGSKKTLNLPHSGIEIRCSREYFELEEGEDNDTIEPEIRIPITIEDYKNNTDPLNKWIEENL